MEPKHKRSSSGGAARKKLPVMKAAARPARPEGKKKKNAMNLNQV